MKLFCLIFGWTKIKEANLKKKNPVTLLSLFYTEDKNVSMVIEILAPFIIILITVLQRDSVAHESYALACVKPFHNDIWIEK